MESSVRAAKKIINQLQKEIINQKKEQVPADSVDNKEENTEESVTADNLEGHDTHRASFEDIIKDLEDHHSELSNDHVHQVVKKHEIIRKSKENQIKREMQK